MTGNRLWEVVWSQASDDVVDRLKICPIEQIERFSDELDTCASARSRLERLRYPNINRNEPWTAPGISPDAERPVSVGLTISHIVVARQHVERPPRMRAQKCRSCPSPARAC